MIGQDMILYKHIPVTEIVPYDQTNSKNNLVSGVFSF